MGFSVSGSFAIIAVGTFIAIGMFYGAASNGAERVTDSQQAAFNDRLEQQNTAINITTAEWDTTGPADTLVIDVKNSGSTALTVNNTDYVVDNELITHVNISNDKHSSESVDGNSDTDLWLPGETLHVEITRNIIDSLRNPADSPDRVKIVAGPGIAASQGVTAA